MRINVAFFCFRLGALALLMAIGPVARALPTGHALDFNGTDNYVSLTLASPPASNYTVTAWVYLRAGGTESGTRMAVLSATTCDASIELLLQSGTTNATDPQYLELGRCGGFDGFLSASPVPFEAWTHVAVTLSSNDVVTYYINGASAGSFTDTDSADNYALGGAVNLGSNSGQRKFDGMLDNVQVWNRVLRPSEIQGNQTQQLTGGEGGLFAWYPFTEGGGGTTADAAGAAGGSAGTLVDSPAWFPVSLMVTTNADSGDGSLRQAVANSVSGQVITFAPGLAGQTITLTSGELLLTNDLIIDASALPGGIQINGAAASRVFEVASNGTVTLNSLTITNGSGLNGNNGGGILNGGTLTLNQCTLAGNSVSAQSGACGGGIFNMGGLTLNECTLAGNSTFAASGDDLGGGLFNSGAATLSECTLAGNTASFGGGIYGNSGALALNQCTVSGNSTRNSGGGVFLATGPVATVDNSIIAGNKEIIGGSGESSGNDLVSFSSSLSFTGVNLTNGAPLLAPLGNYGGPTQTMPPLPGSPALDACTNGTNFSTDQRGYPRVLGPRADIGAVEGVYNAAGPGRLGRVTRLGNGAMQFGFTNFSDMSFTMLGATNLILPISLWSPLGTVTETIFGSGQYQFTDPQATNHPQRFYRARWP